MQYVPPEVQDATTRRGGVRRRRRRKRRRRKRAKQDNKMGYVLMYHEYIYLYESIYTNSTTLGLGPNYRK